MVKKGRSFEERTLEFLRLMKFDAVDGARDTLKIGNFTPDAIGVKEGVLFIIECKDADRFGRMCLQKKMLEFRGRFDEYESCLKKKSGFGSWKHDYSQYRKKNGDPKVWFVLVTKDIVVGETDKEHCRNDKPRLSGIWESDMLDYYTELYEKMDAKCPAKDPKTGKKCPQCEAEEYWSIYDFLGEIGLFKQNVYDAFNVPKILSVKANRTVLRNKVTLYQFTMSPKKLATLAYVARRDTRDKAFYQRQINKDRIEKIGEYIDNPDNLLVNNIIMAFDKTAEKFVKFPDGRDQGILKFPLDYKCCWIIDGQHRFYGFRHARSDMEVPIAALQGLDPVRQSRIFLDINKFQKPVPPEIVWDLLDELQFPEIGSPASTPDHYQAIISRTWKDVNMNGMKSLNYTIGIPSQVDPKGKREFAKLCEALEDLKLAEPNTLSPAANPYWDNDPAKTVKKLSNGINDFFRSMERIFPEDFLKVKDGFVLGAGSGTVMLQLFELIIQYSVTFTNKAPDDNLFDRCLEPLKNEIYEMTTDTTEDKFENKLWNAKKNCSPRDGKKAQLYDFVRTIRHGIKDDSFAAGLPDLPRDRDYKLAEEEARDLLEDVYKPKLGEHWLVKLLGPNSSQYNAIKGTATKKEKNLKEPDIYHKYATLGQSSEIILGHIDDFSDIFLTGKVRFTSKDELKVALSKLRQYKADGSHIQPGKHSNIDAQIADSYLVKFKDCIALSRKEKAKEEFPVESETLKEAVIQAKESPEGAEIVTDPESSDTLPEQTPESTGQSPPEK